MHVTHRASNTSSESSLTSPRVRHHDAHYHSRCARVQATRVSKRSARQSVRIAPLQTPVVTSDNDEAAVAFAALLTQCIHVILASMIGNVAMPVILRKIVQVCVSVVCVCALLIRAFWCVDVCVRDALGLICVRALTPTETRALVTTKHTR
jgi:hypothetical protein